MYWKQAPVQKSTENVYWKQAPVQKSWLIQTS